MSSPRPIIRQLTFFLLAVLLPSTVLLSFGVVLLRQESELNERRLEELKTFAVRHHGDSLFQSLERAAAAVADSGWTRWSSTEPSLLIIGQAADGALTSRPVAMTADGSAQRDPEFDAFLRSVSAFDRDGGPVSEVIARYERRLRSETDAAYRARLKLAMAIRLTRAGANADEQDRSLMAMPSSVTDYNLPFAYFGAERLLMRDALKDEVRARLRADLNGPDWIPEDAWITLSDLMREAGMTSTEDSVALARLMEEHRIAAFAADRPLMLAQNGAPGPSWFPVPGEDWLIRRVPLSGSAAVVAVPLDSLQPDGSDALASIFAGLPGGADGRALPEGFDGLSARIDPAAIVLPSSQQRFLIAGIILVLGLTLFGGYLLWRDVRRETRLAALRSQFVSSVSHELRTPLTSIRLFAETLLEHGGNDAVERERSLSIIANESERLTRMLNNILNTSRIEQGTMSYRPGPGSLDVAVNQAADAMEYAFRQAGVELATDVDPVEALFDPDAVEQAVINLLSNALKYGASGGRVELSCSRNGTHAHISVQDHGPGIPADEQERVFERFYRAQRADDRRVTGAGLGLALVQHIAEGHGGQVTLESQPGSGARFTLSIPLQNLPES